MVSLGSLILIYMFDNLKSCDGRSYPSPSFLSPLTYNSLTITMASETIHETPPLYHAPSAQSSLPTSEKAPLVLQPSVAEPIEGPQVDPSVPRDGRDVSTIAQEYRDQCQLIMSCTNNYFNR